jgi:2-polyprenyl-3-methyl-5-hydroxy-6-metoxy-1,4-benzoquinol methylase
MSHEPHKHAEIASRTPEFMAHEASKPFGWSPAHFVEWATIEHMLESVALPAGASIIDVGCGSGWTSLFLAEAGYRVLGYDLVPANIELARRRAATWHSAARFKVADMEELPAGDPADAALLFDALHHSAHQREALRSIAGRLKPEGWLLLGEASFLHRYSGEARAVRRERGWLERGIELRELTSDLREAGFGDLRRFFQPTRPYEGRGRGFAWQLARLVAANYWVAPQAHLWLAARRLG